MMVKCKRRRRRLVKLRGGTAELEVETGRWRGVRREERICKNCRGGEVEDVKRLVMRCTYVEEEREKLEELMSERVKEWQGMDDNVKVTVVMDRACTDEDVGMLECGRGVLQHMGPIPQDTDDPDTMY